MTLTLVRGEIVELPAMRRFKVDGVECIYYEDNDEVWCVRCSGFNGCEHTGKLVLSGALYTDESVTRKENR